MSNYNKIGNPPSDETDTSFRPNNPSGIRPLLAHVYEPHRVSFPCFVQPKLNGIRALYQNGRFQSRDLHPFPVGLLEHLAAPLREVFDQQIILDGELYLHGWPLQRINAAVTPVRNEPTEDTVKVEYHVFDVVDFTKSFPERFRQVTTSMGQWPGFPVFTQLTSSARAADFHYADFVKHGFEGMMYRLGDCPYTVPNEPAGLRHKTINERSRYLSDKSNRCWHLLKRKSWQDDEFEIIGVQEGEGKYAGMLGAITCETMRRPAHEPGVSIQRASSFSVGSGFADSDRDKFWDHPELIIGKLAKVKYLCLSEDGIPLNPTLLAIL